MGCEKRSNFSMTVYCCWAIGCVSLVDEVMVTKETVAFGNILASANTQAHDSVDWKKGKKNKSGGAVRYCVFF